jgi:mannose-6-phosphate isomerase-like protein (cupin superfamily)
VTESTAPGVDVRSQADALERKYGLDLKLLQPWDGLAAPFEGAWCVLRPGDVSMAHAHHEREIFIGMSGRAEVVSDGTRHPFAAGDIAFLEPGVEHQVVNDSGADFAYYAIWWDGAMSRAFLATNPRDEL